MPLPSGNHQNDLYVYESISVLFIYLFWFLGSTFDRNAFIAILIFVFLIFFLLKNMI